MVGRLKRVVANYRAALIDRPHAALAMVIVLVLVEGALAWSLGLHATLAAYLFFGFAGVVLAESDLRTRRLPNRIVLPSIVIEVVLLAIAGAVRGPWHSLGRAAIAGALFAMFLIALRVVYRHRGGVGGGDIKTAMLVGLALGWLGWSVLFAGVLVAFLAELIVGQGLVLLGRLKRGASVPMGPFLFTGAVIAILLR